LSIAAQRADNLVFLSAPLSAGVFVYSAEARSPRYVSEQVDVIGSAAGNWFARLELSVFATPTATGQATFDPNYPAPHAASSCRVGAA
jgi:hypothetical protein